MLYSYTVIESHMTKLGRLLWVELGCCFALVIASWVVCCVGYGELRCIALDFES